MNFTIPIQQLAGFKIRRGAGGIGWCYGSSGATTYACAVEGLRRAVLERVSGRDANGRDMGFCYLR